MSDSLTRQIDSLTAPEPHEHVCFACGTPFECRLEVSCSEDEEVCVDCLADPEVDCR
jgi:hypothetical protein